MNLLVLFLVYWLISFVFSAIVSIKKVALISQFSKYDAGRLNFIWNALSESAMAFVHSMIMMAAVFYVIKRLMMLAGINNSTVEIVVIVVVFAVPMLFVISEMKIFFSTRLSLLRAHLVQ